MKKRSLVLFLLFVSIAGLISEGRRDFENLPTLKDRSDEAVAMQWRLNKGETINLNGIEVRAIFPDKYARDAVLVAEMIPMREQYKRGEVIKVESPNENLFLGIKRSEDRSSHSVISNRNDLQLNIIDNLDLYIYKFSTDDIHPILSEGVLVELFFSFDYLRKINGGRDPKEQTIFVYDPDDSIWYPLVNSQSGITTISREENGLRLIVSEWPYDDKMIACGP